MAQLFIQVIVGLRHTMNGSHAGVIAERLSWNGVAELG
jgi:hypothetical protein